MRRPASAAPVSSCRVGRPWWFFSALGWRDGQHSAEMTIIVATVSAALIGGQTLVRRGIQARVKVHTDDLLAISNEDAYTAHNGFQQGEETQTRGIAFDVASEETLSTAQGEHCPPGALPLPGQTEYLACQDTTTNTQTAEWNEVTGSSSTSTSATRHHDNRMQVASAGESVFVGHQDLPPRFTANFNEQFRNIPVATPNPSQVGTNPAAMAAAKDRAKSPVQVADNEFDSGDARVTYRNIGREILDKILPDYNITDFLIQIGIVIASLVLSYVGGYLLGPAVEGAQTGAQVGQTTATVAQAGAAAAQAAEAASTIQTVLVTLGTNFAIAHTVSMVSDTLQLGMVAMMSDSDGDLSKRDIKTIRFVTTVVRAALSLALGSYADATLLAPASATQTATQTWTAGIAKFADTFFAGAAKGAVLGAAIAALQPVLEDILMKNGFTKTDEEGNKRLSATGYLIASQAAALGGAVVSALASGLMGLEVRESIPLPKDQAGPPAPAPGGLTFGGHAGLGQAGQNLSNELLRSLMPLLAGAGNIGLRIVLEKHAGEKAANYSSAIMAPIEGMVRGNTGGLYNALLVGLLQAALVALDQDVNGGKTFTPVQSATVMLAVQLVVRTALTTGGFQSGEWNVDQVLGEMAQTLAQNITDWSGSVRPARFAVGADGSSPSELALANFVVSSHIALVDRLTVDPVVSQYLVKETIALFTLGTPEGMELKKEGVEWMGRRVNIYEKDNVQFILDYRNELVAVVIQGAEPQVYMAEQIQRAKDRKETIASIQQQLQLPERMAEMVYGQMLSPEFSNVQPYGHVLEAFQDFNRPGSGNAPAVTPPERRTPAR